MSKLCIMPASNQKLRRILPPYIKQAIVVVIVAGVVVVIVVVLVLVILVEAAAAIVVYRQSSQEVGRAGTSKAQGQSSTVHTTMKASP